MQRRWIDGSNPCMPHETDDVDDDLIHRSRPTRPPVGAAEIATTNRDGIPPPHRIFTEIKCHPRPVTVDSVINDVQRRWSQQQQPLQRKTTRPMWMMGNHEAIASLSPHLYRGVVDVATLQPHSSTRSVKLVELAQLILRVLRMRIYRGSRNSGAIFGAKQNQLMHCRQCTQLPADQGHG